MGMDIERSKLAQNRKTVLVVDDDLDLFEIYQEYLMDLGSFEGVFYAQDGVEGVQMVLNQSFDLILVDLEMPKRGGIEFLQSVQHSPNAKKTEFIIVSGHVTVDHVLQAVDIGIKNVLTKPFSEDEFHCKIKEVMKK